MSGVRPLGARLRRDPVLAVGILLIVAATGFRTWAASQTWFYVDDFPLVNRVHHDGIRLDELFTPYIGHVMPAGRLAAWLTTVGRPYDYPVAIAELMALLVLASAGLLRLLRTLFGSRPGILAPLVCFLLSPWLIPLTSWWAAGINHLPALAATFWALDTHVRYLRRPSRRLLTASVLWVAFGLSFAELALLAYLPLLLVTVCYFAAGSLGARVRHVWETWRGAVVAHAVLVAAYAALYLSTAWTPTEDRPPIPWRDYLLNVLGSVVPSAFIGGPGDWHQVWAAQFEAAPSGPVRLAGLIGLGGVFALSALTRDRGLRAWTIPLAQAAAVIALVGQTRAVFGPDFILDLRFTAPLAAGIPLAIGLAFLPVRGAVESAEPRQAHWAVDRRWPSVVALTLFTALAVRSAATYPLLHLPDELSAQKYFATFEGELDAHDGPVTLVAGVVPTYVFGSGVEAEYRFAMSQYGDRVRVPAVVQDEFQTVDQSGRLVPAGLDVARRDRAGTSGPGCAGHRLEGGSTTIPLDGPVWGWAWRLRVSYTAAAETDARITLGDRSVRTTLLAGRHTLETSGAGQYQEVEVSLPDATAQVCVTRVLVGTTTYPGQPAVEPDAD